MNEKDTLRHLRRWDPAADVETPSAELRARLRARLAETEERPEAGGWLDSLWGFAAVTAAGAILVALTLTRMEGPTGPGDVPSPGVRTLAAADTDTDTKPVQVVYTASNGVRIYWAVTATPSSRL